MADIKRFTTLKLSVIGRYQRVGDRGSKGLEMALFEVLDVSYVIDILYYIIIGGT